MKFIIIFVCELVLLVFGIQESKVLNSISEHIGNIVLECKEEMGFPKNVIQEFLAFWNPQHELTSISQGCAIACVIKKLEVLEPGGYVKIDNTAAFLKANNADSEMSSKLIELFNLCTRAALTKNPADGCILGLEILKCCRYALFRLQWAPKPNVHDQDENNEN